MIMKQIREVAQELPTDVVQAGRQERVDFSLVLGIRTDLVTVRDAAPLARITNADLIIVSVPPGSAGDPALARFRDTIAASNARVIYLSTVGVYADHGGAWIDETATIIHDDTRRGLRAKCR